MMALVQGTRALFRHWMREEVRSLVGWAVTLGLLALGLGVFALRAGQLQEFMELFERNLERLPVVLRLLGGQAALRDPSFLVSAAVFNTVAPILLLIYTSSAVLRIYTAEASGGSLEFLLALPVSRRRLIATRIGVFLIGLAVLVVALLAGVWGGMALGGGRVGGWTLVGAALGLFALFACLGGLGFLVSLAFREHTQGLLALLGLQLALFVLGLVLEDGSSVLRVFNPYHYYGGARVLTGGAVTAGCDLGILFGGAVVLWAFGGLVFVRKQI